MFEAAELGRKVSKESYKRRVPALRAELLEAQQQLRGAPFPVIVVFAGVDGAGKGETVNLLNEWMDPRWILTRAFGEPSDEERERPEQWRFWRELPPHGRIGLFLSAWYSRPVLDRVYGRTTRVEFEHDLARLAEFEKTLADDGALLLKFWMHLGKKAQRKRLRTLERDPLTRWRVTKLQWRHWKMYGRFITAAEQAIRSTSTAQAPWTIVEGRDEEYRSLVVAEKLHDAIRGRLTGRQAADAAARDPRAGRTGSPPDRVASASVRARHVETDREADLRARPPEAPGRAGRAAAARGGEGRLDDSGLRGLGRVGEGGRDPPRDRGARRASVPGDPDCRPHRRGARAALSLALLAPPAARRPAHDLRSQLVRPRARRARRRPAIAPGGRHTNSRSTTWSSARARGGPPGRWWKRTTNITRASRCCRRRASGCAARSSGTTL